MSSSANKMQHYDNNDNSTSNSNTNLMYDNIDGNVEMRFIIRVRLSTSRNESGFANNP